MNYKEATKFLFNSLPMYQRIGKIAYKKDIGNIKIACEEFNQPQKNFKNEPQGVPELAQTGLELIEN